MARRTPEESLQVDHLQADLLGRSVRGGAVTVGALGLKVAMQLAMVIVLSRLLPPEAFGLIAMIAVLTEILENVKDFGLATATIQMKDITHEQVTTLFWINSSLGAAIALAMYAAAPLIAQFYNHPELTEVARWMTATFILGGLSTQHWALLVRQMRFKTLAAINLGGELLAMAAAVVAALAGAGYWALVVQRLTYWVVASPAMWIASGWRPGWPRRCTGLKSLLVFGGSVNGSTIVDVLGRNVDQALIGWYWGALPLGLYERAYKLLMSPANTCAAPVNSVGMPALSRLHDNPERYRHAYLSLLERLAMLTVPAAALTIVTADWLVAILLGEQWHESAPILAWLSLTAALTPVIAATGLLFTTQGRGPELFKVGAGSLAIVVIAVAVGLPFGPIAIAAGLALGTLLGRVPLWFWFAGRRGPVSAADLYAAVMPSAAAACAVLGATYAFRQLLIAKTMPPVVALVLCACVAGSVGLISFACIPRSRRALLSTVGLLSIVFRRRKVAA